MVYLLHSSPSLQLKVMGNCSLLAASLGDFSAQKNDKSLCLDFSKNVSLLSLWQNLFSKLKQFMRILMPLKPHSLMVLLLFEKKKKSPRSNCISGHDWSTVIYGGEFLWSLRNLLFRNSQKDHLMLTGKIL